MTWDPSIVQERSSISYDSKRTGIKVCVAQIFEIWVVKKAELAVGDPENKFKGRAVLYGSWVKDEHYEVALFNEMGSSPASMQAGKAVDCFGSQPGYCIQQADAEAANTQCELKGIPTWVRLPDDRWPDSSYIIDKLGT